MEAAGEGAGRETEGGEEEDRIQRDEFRQRGGTVSKGFRVVARQLEHSRTNPLAIPRIPVHWQVTLSNSRLTLPICLRTRSRAGTLEYRWWPQFMAGELASEFAG